jgi:hypothetical protein
MKFIAKLAKQGVMMALVAVVAAWVGAQVTVQQGQPLQVAVKPIPQIIFVDDGPKLCAAGC